MASDIAIRRREPRLAGLDADRAPATPAQAAGAGEDDRETEELDRRPTKTLTRRLLAINLVPLALFLLGVLYLDNYREGLVAQKIDSLIEHGEVIAGALGETVVAVGLEDTTQPPITHIMASQARSLVRRLVTSSGTRLRLYQVSGELIADSRQLIGAGGLVQREALPPPGEEGSFERWLRRIDRVALGITPLLQPYEAYRESPEQTAWDYPEITHAMIGETGHALRDAGRDGLILTVAVPIRHYKQVQGALLLSSTLEDVEAELRAVRSDILGLALMAFALTVLLSLYLAGTIARPVRNLAQAADAVRHGHGRAGTIPDYRRRGDEIGELSRALIDMTHTLEQRMVAIEQFAADVAHEIKNPLSSLKSAIDTIQRIEDPARRAQLFGIASEDLRRIDRLITDISDASRLDAELSRATSERVDVGLLLQALSDVIGATWGEDGPLLETGEGLAGEDLAGRFVVDAVEDRLVQVIRNLLANARSFSPAGGRVTIDCRREGRWIEITIADQGPGIPAGKEEAIFDRFYSDRPAGEKFGTHSGLGLSISKQIVTAAGGSIRARNLGEDTNQPEGACFTVRLPAAKEA